MKIKPEKGWEAKEIELPCHIGQEEFYTIKVAAIIRKGIAVTHQIKASNAVGLLVFWKGKYQINHLQSGYRIKDEFPSKKKAVWFATRLGDQADFTKSRTGMMRKKSDREVFKKAMRKTIQEYWLEFPEEEPVF